jgi:hypothetical protein
MILKQVKLKLNEADFPILKLISLDIVRGHAYNEFRRFLAVDKCKY